MAARHDLSTDPGLQEDVLQVRRGTGLTPLANWMVTSWPRRLDSQFCGRTLGEERLLSVVRPPALRQRASVNPPNPKRSLSLPTTFLT
jgi:hypothetical protein